MRSTLWVEITSPWVAEWSTTGQRLRTLNGRMTTIILFTERRNGPILTTSLMLSYLSKFLNSALLFQKMLNIYHHTHALSGFTRPINGADIIPTYIEGFEVTLLPTSSTLRTIGQRRKLKSHVSSYHYFIHWPDYYLANPACLLSELHILPLFLLFIFIFKGPNSRQVISSVLWRCWLGGRKGIRSVKTEWWGTGAWFKWFAWSR